MKRSCIWLIALLLGTSESPAQTISFTFDDGLDPRVQPEAAAWNDAILAALAGAGVEAMLFPTGKVVDSPEGLALVRQWSEGGHAIGNHTYSHQSLGSSRMLLENFTADVARAERLLGGLPGFQRRLRFPYLKEGDTEAKRDGMRHWMRANGYQPAPVSIDTSDWYYNQRFLAWRKVHPTEDAARFRERYLAHLWERATFYDSLARELMGRRPPHVMLLHVNRVNGEFFADAVAMFRQRGWQVVSPRDAFADALYTEAVQSLPAGESILWARAKKAGHAGLRYPAEDGDYEAAVLDGAGF